MRYLITGATGLVGKELVRICHEKGVAVNYLSTRREKIVSSDNFQGFYWNPAKGEIDTACFNGVTAVINLAGAPISKRWTAKYKKIILSSRIDSLRTLRKSIEGLASNKIDSFVSASAIGIYPNSLENYYEEDASEVDDSLLGEVVALWEMEIDKFKMFDFAVSKVRIGLVLSSEGGALPQMAKPVKMFAGAAFGSGEQWQSWIHLTDLARIFLFIADNRLRGTFNGVAPNPVTQKKLIKAIADVLERPLILPNIPKVFVRALLGEMSYLVFVSQRVSSKKLEKQGFNFHHQNITGALDSIYLANEGGHLDSIDVNKEFIS